MSILRRYRVPTLAGLLACAAAVTWALPPVSWTKYYYSDPGHSTWVGEQSLFCDGSRFSEGQKTAYWEYVVWESCGVCNPNWENCVP